MRKTVGCLWLVCTVFPLLALRGIDSIQADAGFEVHHEALFLHKNTNEYAPDTISNTSGAAFCSIELTAGNQNILVQPGIIIKEQQFMPFIRKLRYSLFTDWFSLSAGKASFSFGEGIMKNYFFVHLPQSAGFRKMTYPAVWHTVLEVPVRQFLFTAGVFADADSTALWKAPKWYNLWTKAVYSNSVLSVGLEADALFQPEFIGTAAESMYKRAAAAYLHNSESGNRKTAASVGQQKAYTFTTAAEVLVLLPYQCKLYVNAQLPVDLLHKKITDWGTLAGISKDFLWDSFMLSSIAEVSYSPEGFAYSVFQSMGVTDYAQISAGMHGLEAKQLVGIVQMEFFISDFSIKAGYISKDMLEKQKTDMSYLGIFSIAVCFNGDL